MDIPKITTTPATSLEQFTKEYIQEKIKTENAWTIRTLQIVFANQTPDEQETQEANHQNGKGFGKIDSQILSDFHLQMTTRKFLSPKQMDICKKRLPKYWNQVLQAITIAKENYDNRGKIAGKKFGF